MKILHVSNIVSPHQLPLAHELRRIVGDGNYIYAAMQLPDKERKKLGWDSDDAEPWIISPAKSEQDRIAFELYWKEFDVVICGERLFDEMAERVRSGKLCFYMSERWWKPPIGRLRIFYPPYYRMVKKFKTLSSNPYFHYLPTGRHASKDIQFVSDFNERIWGWGYFTSSNIYDNQKSKNGSLNVIWAGRMLKWKLVRDIIRAISVLPNSNINLKLIGEGPERSSLEKLAGKVLIDGTYSFNNFLPVEKIPQVMAINDVYVLPSSEYEGWGAVINEAMSVGCVPVVSRGAGAAAMIEDGVDGLLFDVGDWRRLSEILYTLSVDTDYRSRLSNNAKIKIEEVWSPAVAAERFVDVAKSLINGDEPPVFLDGPMSR